MAVASILSTVMARKVAHQLDELTSKYVEAYNHLVRMNVTSLERSLALRRMIIAKTQSPPDEAGYAERKTIYLMAGDEVEKDAQAARALINAIIADVTTDSDNAALGRLDGRIDDANRDLYRQMDTDGRQLFAQLEAPTPNMPEARHIMVQIDTLRDEFNARINAIRVEMMAQVRADAATTMRDQQHTILISVILTVLASVLGLTFSLYISTDIVRPVRRLLEGTRAVESGRLDSTIAVTTRDEIGLLTTAFNGMVEQLRHKERMRETFGRYIDPRVVEGLIGPSLAATDGQRRVMTVLFCDMKGFTGLSEGMTPQGLVKVMNHYLSTMSEPIRQNRGIIDKYIGDAIMAYWGPPFTGETDHARLACEAAIAMVERAARLRTELPELLGVRTVPSECEVRIGIATGEVLVGSIGSEYMMSYTVMGDAVNLASRLEGANSVYGSHTLMSDATRIAAGDAIATREIDRLVVIGQSRPQTVFEIMGATENLSPDHLALKARYAEGLAAYRARRWDDAHDAFEAALAAVPGDGPSLAMLRRLDALRDHAPAGDWDGAWRMDHK